MFKNWWLQVYMGYIFNSNKAFQLWYFCVCFLPKNFLMQEKKLIHEKTRHIHIIE